MHVIQSTQVVELLVMETGTYNQQWRRPFETNLDASSLTMFQNQLSNSGSYQPAMLNGIANNFILPAAQPEKQIVVPGNWGDQRMLFRAKVIHTFRMGGTITEIVQGYTNFLGASESGFDRELEFYANSTLIVRDSQEMTPTGIQTFSTVADNSHILVDNQWEGIYNATEQRMRPEDIISAMSRAHLDVPAGQLLDGRSAFTNVAVKSNRHNSMAPHFMAKILEADRCARGAEEFGQGEQQILAQARGYAADNNVGKDPFLSAISAIRGTALGNTFSWRDLERLDPNVSRVTTVLRMGAAERADAHWAGQTADWAVADTETQAASILSHSVCGLMFDEQLVELAFKCTNNVPGGQAYLLPLHGVTLKNEPVAVTIDKFSTRFIQEVWNDLTHGNQVACNMELSINQYGDSWIKLSFNNEPLTDYVVPTFADALMVPVLTSNPDVAQNIANDFDSLISLLHSNCEGYTNADYHPPQVQGQAGIVDVFGNAIQSSVPNAYQPKI